MRPIEILAIIMFFLSFYGLVISRKMIKTVVCSIMMEASIIMFFLGVGFLNTIRPTYAGVETTLLIADPMPQALMITAIIIGVAVTTIKITMLMSVFRKYKTTDWEKARRINRSWIADAATEDEAIHH